MIIREETDADIASVRKVIAAAFGQSDEAERVDALRTRGDVEIALVAEDEGAVIGHVMLSRMEMPANTLGLAPVSVRPDRQGQGVGSALIRRAIGEARNKGWSAIFVVGEPAFYQRFGFTARAAAGYKSPYPAPYLMALELTSGTLTDKGDALAYAPPFDGIG